ncbi:hypothetical protein ACIBCH_26815 [Amycolatopsis thailandensis]|uniref:hypothetical protein n=1 Tax=Amycolatopsis thailandensis TaxID=589330 RepID=UPI00379A9BAD
MLAVYVSEDLTATSGLHEVTADPIIKYYRTVHEWQPAILTPEESAELAELPQLTPQPRHPDGDALARDERALREDGRRTHEERSRPCGAGSSHFAATGGCTSAPWWNPLCSACRSKPCCGSAVVRPMWTNSGGSCSLRRMSVTPRPPWGSVPASELRD